MNDHKQEKDADAVALQDEQRPSLSREAVDEAPTDVVALKRLTRKCDYRLIPPLFTLYLLAFLDRTNIGNAKIQGLEAGLGLHGSDYNVALFVFFIPYILFEVPCNLILRKVSPSTWLCSIMVLWGICTIGVGLIYNLAGLVSMRFLLGVFEAGFFPGCVYLISMYYERYELQWRVTLFFSASILAGAFGGLLAYAIVEMDGISGYAGWRWIFIIEGLLTVVVGAAAKFWVVDWPETAKFLNTEERALLIHKLALSTGECGMDRLDRKSAKRIILDWKIWCGTVMYMGVATTSYSTSFFIPTIINQLGYTAKSAQLLTIPIFVTAAFFALATAWAADKLKHRYAFAMLGVGVAIIGYIVLLNASSVSIVGRYIACFLITIGAFICQPVVITWLANQMSGHYKRSMGAAIQVGVGNICGIVASNIYIGTEAPRYPTGFGAGLAFMVLCGVTSTVFYFGLKWENKQRDAGKRDHRYQKDPSELANMGDDHPSFRFTL